MLLVILMVKKSLECLMKKDYQKETEFRIEKAIKIKGDTLYYDN